MLSIALLGKAPTSPWPPPGADHWPSRSVSSITFDPGGRSSQTGFGIGGYFEPFVRCRRIPELAISKLFRAWSLASPSLAEAPAQREEAHLLVLLQEEGGPLRLLQWDGRSPLEPSVRAALALTVEVASRHYGQRVEREFRRFGADGVSPF